MSVDFHVPEQEIAELCRRYRLRRLSIFGSMLRGDFRPESDVDLLVEFTPDAEIGFLALSRMARELSALLGKPVDLVPRNGLKPAVRESILQEERVIYAS